MVVQDPRHLLHSTWLKKVNRTLILNVSEENPSPELQELVLFIEIIHANVVY